MLLLDVCEAHARDYAPLATLLDCARLVHLELHISCISRCLVHIGVLQQLLRLDDLTASVVQRLDLGAGHVLSRVLLKGQVLKQILVHHSATVRRVEHGGLL